MKASVNVWLPLAPALVVALYWFIGLFVFSIRSAMTILEMSIRLVRAACTTKPSAMPKR